MTAQPRKEPRVLGAPKPVVFDLSDNYGAGKPKPLFGAQYWDRQVEAGASARAMADSARRLARASLVALPARAPDKTVPVPPEWYGKLRAWRKTRRLTLKQAAALLGVKTPTVSWWEQRKPKRMNRERYAAACLAMGQTA